MKYWIGAACLLAAAAGMALSGINEYFFYAAFVVLQYVVLATAWNILGGYAGYVNFGSAAFFAAGAYSTVALHKFFPLPIPALLAIVLQTLIINWDYVGGSRGAYLLRPNEFPLIGSYVQYLFLLMLILAIVA